MGLLRKELAKNCPGYIQVSESFPRNIGLNVTVGYGAFKLDNVASVVCPRINGFGYIKNNDSLIIDYSAINMPPGPPFPLYPSGGERKDYKFIGIRKL